MLTRQLALVLDDAGCYCPPTFCCLIAVSATILLGAVSERATLHACIVSVVIVGGLAFPIVSHWLWSEDGWLGYIKVTGRLFGSGAFDLAGSGVVHITGGTAALIAAGLVGPRLGRYDDSSRGAFTPHNIVALCTGTFQLWAGFVIFNSASVLIITDNFVAAGRCLINTLLSGCTGGLTMLAVSRLSRAHYSVLDVMNGVLAGLVGICSSCSVVLPYSALITGSVCALVSFACEKAMNKYEIDDPVAAAPLHLGAGISGLLLTGFTAYPPYLRDAFPGRASYPGGLFYGGDSPGALLGAQAVAVVSIIGVVALLLTPALLALKLCGVLTYSEEEQLMGADEVMHGGAAYHFSEDEASADQLTTWQASTPQLSPRPNRASGAVWQAPTTAALRPSRVDEGASVAVQHSVAPRKGGASSEDSVQSDMTGGAQYASFAVTTDSGLRSGTRRQYVGSASAIAASASRRVAASAATASNLDGRVEAVAPIPGSLHSTF